MPWWLAGISHHMSGYSAVLFVAYAGVAYTSGITVYFWGFASIGIGVGIGSWLFAGRWNRLRSKLGQKSTGCRSTTCRYCPSVPPSSS